MEKSHTQFLLLRLHPQWKTINDNKQEYNDTQHNKWQWKLLPLSCKKNNDVQLLSKNWLWLPIVTYKCEGDGKSYNKCNGCRRTTYNTMKWLYQGLLEGYCMVDENLKKMSSQQKCKKWMKKKNKKVGSKCGCHSKFQWWYKCPRCHQLFGVEDIL